MTQVDEEFKAGVRGITNIARQTKTFLWVFLLFTKGLLFGKNWPISAWKVPYRIFLMLASISLVACKRTSKIFFLFNGAARIWSALVCVYFDIRPWVSMSRNQRKKGQATPVIQSQKATASASNEPWSINVSILERTLHCDGASEHWTRGGAR